MDRPDDTPTAPHPVRMAHFELGPGPEMDESRRMAWVDAVEELAVRIAAAAGLGREESWDLGVAVREAVVNALRHGCDRPRSRVSVSFRLAPGPKLVATVRDRGLGFDPETLPDPRAPENLEKGGGRGVFYMRQFSDEVAFDFPARGGTVARLVKQLPPASPTHIPDPGLEEWLGPLPSAR